MALRRFSAIMMIVMMAAVPLHTRAAQDEPGLVARLAVETPGVEVRRVNTEGWVPIHTELLIGAGDSIRTNEKGKAVLNFFDGVQSFSLLPSGRATLDQFSGKADEFALIVSLEQGFANARTNRDLDAKTNYQIKMPTYATDLLQGELLLRVEPDQRSAALDVSTGTTTARWTDGNTAALSQNTGVRVAADQTNSEVVPATSFETLDSALNGCPSALKLDGDVQLNVRNGADLSFDRIGGLEPQAKVQAMGVTVSGDWYRIRYADGFGWINVSRLPLDKDCAGLRRFPPKYGEGGAVPAAAATEAPTLTPTGTPTATP